MSDAIKYEVWWYAPDGEYDGCCGHQHDTEAEARKCMKDDPWLGHHGRVVAQAEVRT